MSTRALVAFALLGLAVFALAYVASFAFSARGPAPHERAAASDAGPAHDTGDFWALEPDRFSPDGSVLAAPSRDDFACLVPRLPIVRDAACDRGEPYPACRWQLPDEEASGGLHRIWRNTTPEHRWARPALVSVVAVGSPMPKVTIPA